MQNLPFQTRGPFEITGWVPPFGRSPEKFVSVLPLYKALRSCRNGKPSYPAGSTLTAIPYYRMPTQADRGPFRVSGKWVEKDYRRVYTFCLTATLLWCEDPLRFRGSNILAQTGRAPWIYYSRNISNRQTIH